MLTYQLQHRVFKIQKDEDLILPNNVEIEICLEPTEQFGVGEGPTKTALVGSNIKLLWGCKYGKNMGRVRYSSETR